MEDDEKVSPYRRALTQIHAIMIVIVVIITGAGAYFLGLIPGTTSMLNPTTTVTHSTTPLPQILGPGTGEKQYFTLQGYNRSYIIHTSKIYDPQKPAPLIFVLHGAGQDPLTASTYGFSQKVDQSGGIAVYPAGISLVMHTSYEVKDNPSKIDDNGFILEILYRLKQQYKIDPDRIYATGYSNGGFMSHDLASQHSEIFAAIGPDASGIGSREAASDPLLKISAPKEPVSVIIFHGTADLLVPYSGGVGAGDEVFLPVADSVAFWVNANGCSKIVLNTTSVDGKMIRSVYSNGLKGSEVVLYTIVDGKHVWPADATSLIWDFFMSHPKQH